MLLNYTTKDVERFWAKVDIRTFSECWPWLGYCTEKGYGKFSPQEQYPKRAHIVAYILAFGPIRDSLLVLHTCDNPPCCNPTHLFLGTNQDNMDDMQRKGHTRGERNGFSKLIEQQVIEMRIMHATEQYTMQQIADYFSVSRGAARDAIDHVNWKHIP